MVRDDLRNYLGLAVGLTAVTRERARAAAKALVAGGGATAEQVTSLAEDLLSTSRSNREAITALVKVEVERSLGRLGLATADQLRSLTARLAAAETALRHAQTTRPAAASAGIKAVPKKAAPNKAAPKKAAPNKAAPKKAAPKKVPSKKAAPVKPTAKKVAPNKAAPNKVQASPEGGTP